MGKDTKVMNSKNYKHGLFKKNNEVNCMNVLPTSGSVLDRLTKLISLSEGIKRDVNWIRIESHKLEKDDKPVGVTILGRVKEAKSKIDTAIEVINSIIPMEDDMDKILGVSAGVSTKELRAAKKAFTDVHYNMVQLLQMAKPTNFPARNVRQLFKHDIKEVMSAIKDIRAAERLLSRVSRKI